jgi:hypothetical protein
MAGLVGLATFSSPPAHVAFAQADPSPIAFVRSNDATGDEIWLIQPDGSNTRRIWSVSQPDPNHILDISDLDWRPDASALAFSSDHEFACSLFDSDIYTIWPDGSGYRRVTNAPGCTGFANYPKGTVTVTVRNFTTRGPLYVYVQGAPSFQFVLPGEVNTVTLANVADFGDGVMQQAVVSDGPHRWIAPIALADVKPGQVVHAGTIDVAGAGIDQYGAYLPSWRRDGTQLGYVLGSCASMYQISPQSLAGEFGQPILDESKGYVFPCVIDRGPTPATVNQVLYYSYLNGGIYRVNEGSAESGTKLVATEAYELVFDVQWLPDGSGFLFTKKTFDQNFVDNANVFAYSFATGDSTQLTQFTGEFARDMSVSSNGQLIVFERSATDEFSAVDLWIMERDGTGMRLLVSNGRLPSWSQGAPQSPKKVFVSLLRR